MHFKLHIRRVQLIINPRGIIISFMCIQVASSLDVVLASSSPVVGSYQRHPDLLECPGIRPCESALAFRCCRTRTGFVPPCVSGAFFCVLGPITLITIIIIILGKVRRLYTYPYCSPTRRPVLIPCWLISPLPVHEWYARHKDLVRCPCGISSPSKLALQFSACITTNGNPRPHPPHPLPIPWRW